MRTLFHHVRLNVDENLEPSLSSSFLLTENSWKGEYCYPTPQGSRTIAAAKSIGTGLAPQAHD
jgi:hypothetical protein